jgi:glucan phosphoethanolaminetransferase (alkaline phosphatase superfamily)
LTRCQCKSGLIFFSDHGERLFDNGLTDENFGHGFPAIARQEIEIPFLIWLSSVYQRAEPSALMRLREHARSAAQLHNLFETIMDMAGVEYDNRGSALSLFSDHWQPPTILQVLGLNGDIVILPVEELAIAARETRFSRGGQ